MRVMMWGSVTRARVRSSTWATNIFLIAELFPLYPTHRVCEHDAWVAAGRVPRHGDGDGGAVVRGGQQQVRVGGGVRGDGAGAGRGLRRELGPGHRPAEDGRSDSGGQRIGRSDSGGQRMGGQTVEVRGWDQSFLN